MLDGASATGEEEDSKGGKKAGKHANGARVELYNLATDLGEEKDLASTEAERAKLRTEKLKTMLLDAVVPGDKGHDPPAAAINGKNKQAS
jgi:hypothetical protein